MQIFGVKTQPYFATSAMLSWPAPLKRRPFLCHLERSREISYSGERSEEKRTVRDVSTPLDMTNLSGPSVNRAAAMAPPFGKRTVPSVTRRYSNRFTTSLRCRSSSSGMTPPNES